MNKSSVKNYNFKLIITHEYVSFLVDAMAHQVIHIVNEIKLVYLSSILYLVYLNNWRLKVLYDQLIYIVKCNMYQKQLNTQF